MSSNQYVLRAVIACRCVLNVSRFSPQGVDCTIQQLREALVAMKRTDVVALLDEELESLQPKGI